MTLEVWLSYLSIVHLLLPQAIQYLDKQTKIAKKPALSGARDVYGTLIRLEGLRPGDGRPPTKNNSFECCGYCSSNSSVCNRFLSKDQPSTRLLGSRLGLRVLFLIELLLVLLTSAGFGSLLGWGYGVYEPIILT